MNIIKRRWDAKESDKETNKKRKERIKRKKNQRKGKRLKEQNAKFVKKCDKRESGGEVEKMLERKYVIGSE